MWKNFLTRRSVREDVAYYKEGTENLVARYVNCGGNHVDKQWIGGESKLACSFEC